MKKRFFLVASSIVICSLAFTGILSAKDNPKTKENKLLYEAKLILIKAKNSNDPKVIKSNVLKAEAIIKNDNRPLGGHKTEALKWIKESLKWLSKNDIKKAKRYAYKAKKQVFLAIEELKRDGKY